METFLSIGVQCHQNVYWKSNLECYILHLPLTKVCPLLASLKWNWSSFFFFLPRLVACRITVPQEGIKPVYPALEAWSLNHWTAREVPTQLLDGGIEPLGSNIAVFLRLFLGPPSKSTVLVKNENFWTILQLYWTTISIRGARNLHI